MHIILFVLVGCVILLVLFLVFYFTKTKHESSSQKKNEAINSNMCNFNITTKLEELQDAHEELVSKSLYDVFNVGIELFNMFIAFLFDMVKMSHSNNPIDNIPLADIKSTLNAVVDDKLFKVKDHDRIFVAFIYNIDTSITTTMTAQEFLHSFVSDIYIDISKKAGFADWNAQQQVTADNYNYIIDFYNEKSEYYHANFISDYVLIASITTNFFNTMIDCIHNAAAFSDLSDLAAKGPAILIKIDEYISQMDAINDRLMRLLR